MIMLSRMGLTSGLVNPTRAFLANGYYFDLNIFTKAVDKTDVGRNYKAGTERILDETLIFDSYFILKQ